MGLDTSHDCWHGSYGLFNCWRTEIAAAAGLPPLDLMEGFYAPEFTRGSDNLPDHICNTLPIRWDCLKPSALYELLSHSDCDGFIPAQRCAPIADALEEVLPKLTDDPPWLREKTQQFIDGLRLAASRIENVDFH